LQRVTVSLDESLSHNFDLILRDQGYSSRSEAVRDLVRQAVETRRLQEDGETVCVASLSYVYDHHIRALAQRLVEIGHEQHDLVVSTTHVHLDHYACLETTILKGRARDVRALADRIQAERGVRFCHLNLISVDPNDQHSDQVGDHHHTGHVHQSPHRG